MRSLDIRQNDLIPGNSRKLHLEQYFFHVIINLPDNFDV